MRNRLGTICMALGIALILGAMLLLVYNKYEDHKAREASDRILEQIQELNASLGDVTPDPYGEMTEKMIDGYEYIGFLTLPTINMELPVMSEWDYSKLRIAPCRYYGSAKTNDIVIAGHNYPSHFGMLKNLKLGDTVVFTDMDNVHYLYEVAEIEQLEPSDVEPMQESDYDLTLFTCTLGGKHRVTVRCVRSE